MRMCWRRFETSSPSPRSPIRRTSWGSQRHGQFSRGSPPPAPPHNPANLLGIEAARRVFPGVPQVAVFDTAFHQSMPAHAFTYALPYSFYALHHVRRYGFHGTSHLWVAKEAAAHLGKPLQFLHFITLHLGNV